MAADGKPRVLVVTTTPGPARALADVILALRARSTTVVLSSSDRSYGQNTAVYKEFDIACEEIEALLPDYRPLAVSDEQAQRLIERIRPDFVLAGAVNAPDASARPIEDVVCGVASRRGLANAQFVEGWDIWHPRDWTPPDAGAYLAIDEPAAAVLRDAGAPADHIHIVGYSRSLLTPAAIDPLERARIRSELKVGDDTRLIGYFGQVNCDNATTLGWVAHAMAETDRLLFQRHPRDQKPLSVQLAGCPPGRVEVSAIPSMRAFHAIDLCVTHFSLTSFAAAALGIPTILCLLPDDVRRIRRICGAHPTTLLGGTVECYDFEGVRRAIAEARRPQRAFTDGVRRAAAEFSQNVMAQIFRQLGHPIELGVHQHGD
jgi:hypothetical protein